MVMVFSFNDNDINVSAWALSILKCYTLFMNVKIHNEHCVHTMPFVINSISVFSSWKYWCMHSYFFFSSKRETSQHKAIKKNLLSIFPMNCELTYCLSSGYTVKSFVKFLGIHPKRMNVNTNLCTLLFTEKIPEFAAKRGWNSKANGKEIRIKKKQTKLVSNCDVFCLQTVKICE